MRPDEIDIDWIYLIERIESLIDLGEELLNRRLGDNQPDPQLLAKQLAFVWTREGLGGYLREIPTPDIPDLGDLIGLDQIINELRRNTMQFALGYRSNNVLLWGERGCGKSSLIKGLLAEFAPLNLRLIEVCSEDLCRLPLIVNPLRTLPYRFILFCDDISFRVEDSNYRGLKNLLEGGVEGRPENVLVYATSNRRHLLPEQLSANELHPEEAIAERLSLADRFGLCFSFYPLDQEAYLSIVLQLARRAGLKSRSASIRTAALQWAQARGYRSGRVARQFVDDLAGRTALMHRLRDEQAHQGK